MNTDEHGSELNLLTEAVIGCAFRVSNKMGVGYLEKVYENATCVALPKAGLRFQQQVEFDVLYEGEVVGQYFAGLIVEGKVLVEVKHTRGLDDAHTAQCLNYLTATGLPVRLRINFAKPSIDIRRLAGRSYTP
jgi:GxxExxY protein